ncbi:MAG: hypothetical protein AB1898_13140 [Acidobacteriota bacterium]
MKVSVKRLRNCLYSRPLVQAGGFTQASPQTNKNICDHPEMKLNWTVEACGPCKVYVNRNKPPEPEPKASAPEKKRAPRKTKAS